MMTIPAAHRKILFRCPTLLFIVIISFLNQQLLVQAKDGAVNCKFPNDITPSQFPSLTLSEDCWTFARQESADFWETVDLDDQGFAQMTYNACKSRGSRPPLNACGEFPIFCGLMFERILGRIQTVRTNVGAMEAFKAEEVRYLKEALNSSNLFAHRNLLFGVRLAPDSSHPENELSAEISKKASELKKFVSRSNAIFSKLPMPPENQDALHSSTMALVGDVLEKASSKAQPQAHSLYALFRGDTMTMKSTLAHLIVGWSLFPVNSGSSTTIWPTKYCHDRTVREPKLTIDPSLGVVLKQCNVSIVKMMNLWEDILSKPECSPPTPPDATSLRPDHCVKHNALLAEMLQWDSLSVDAAKNSSVYKPFPPSTVNGEAKILETLELLHRLGRISFKAAHRFPENMTGCSTDFLITAGAQPPLIVTTPFRIFEHVGTDSNIGEFCIVDTAGINEALSQKIKPLLDIHDHVLKAAQVVVTAVKGQPTHRAVPMQSFPKQFRLVLHSLHAVKSAGATFHEALAWANSTEYFGDLVADATKDIYQSLPRYALQAMLYEAVLRDALLAYNPESMVIDPCATDSEKWIAEQKITRPRLKAPTLELRGYILNEGDTTNLVGNPLISAKDFQALNKVPSEQPFPPDDFWDVMDAGLKTVDAFYKVSKVEHIIRRMVLGSLHNGNLIRKQLLLDEVQTASQNVAQHVVNFMKPNVEIRYLELHKQHQGCSQAALQLNAIVSPNFRSSFSAIIEAWSKIATATLSQSTAAMLPPLRLSEVERQPPKLAFAVVEAAVAEIQYWEKTESLLADVWKKTILNECTSELADPHNFDLSASLQQCNEPEVLSMRFDAFQLQRPETCNGDAAQAFVVKRLTDDSELCEKGWLFQKTLCSFQAAVLRAKTELAIRAFLIEYCRPDTEEITSYFQKIVTKAGQVHDTVDQRRAKLDTLLRKFEDWVNNNYDDLTKLCNGKCHPYKVTRQKLPAGIFLQGPRRGRAFIAANGGGVRGIISIAIYRAIEAKTKASCLRSPFEAATAVFGVSTGAIFMTGIAIGKSSEELLKAYVSEAAQIFPEGPASQLRAMAKIVSGKPAHNADNVRSVLEKQFGPENKRVRLSDERFEKLHILALKNDPARKERTVLAFDKNYYSDILVLDAVMAAAASAPTYFTPVVLNGVAFEDAGQVMNDPSCALIDDITPNDVIISLGTGWTETTHYMEFSGVSDVLSQHLYFKAVAVSQGDCRRKLEQKMGQRFILLDPQLSKKYEMDDKDVVLELKHFAEEWLEQSENKEKVERAADLLCKTAVNNEQASTMDSEELGFINRYSFHDEL